MMNRRQFISLAAAAGSTSLLSGAVANTLPLGDICRTRPSAGLRKINATYSGELVIAGTRLFKEGFLDDLLPLYREASGNRATMLGGGCDDGVAGVRLASAHLGGVCCPLDSPPSKGLAGYQVANDMKVILAHPSVTTNNVSLAQLKGILRGGILNWAALGGADQSISLVVHDHCPDYLEPMRQTLLGDKPIWSSQAMQVKTDQKHLETVARFPGAVGVNSWILAEPFVRSGQLKLLRLDGVEPTLRNTESGKYPLAGPLILIFERWNGHMHPLFSFMYSDAGRKVLAQRVIPVTAQQAGYRRTGAIRT
jgi:phosphate transport system substrate-binding protein